MVLGHILDFWDFTTEIRICERVIVPDVVCGFRPYAVKLSGFARPESVLVFRSAGSVIIVVADEVV